jgi:ATP-dependent Zn protease
VATLAVWWRVLTGGSLNPLDGLHLGPDAMLWLPMVALVLLVAVVLLRPMLGQGRSPQLTWRPSRSTSPSTTSRASAAYLSGVGRRLEVLSIVKRKDALGLLAHNDTEERWTRTRTELLAFLRIACAGMAAEELWFGESTTGPGGDLVGGTGIAAQMVGCWA